MFILQLFKFFIQFESLIDFKVKNRNENEFCRIVKILFVLFFLDYYCYVIFIVFLLCWSYLLFIGSRKFFDWYF